MLAATINFEGATKDGAQHINQQLEATNKKLRELLENAVRANHEALRFLLLRDGRWFSDNWKNRQFFYKFRKFDRMGRIWWVAFNSLAYGFFLPVGAVIAFKEQGLAHLASLTYDSILPTFAAVTTFYATNAFRDWKELKAEHKKFGYAFDFMKDIPREMLHRGWAVTEQAIYMVDTEKDKDEPQKLKDFRGLKFSPASSSRKRITRGFACSTGKGGHPGYLRPSRRQRRTHANGRGLHPFEDRRAGAERELIEIRHLGLSRQPDVSPTRRSHLMKEG